MRRHHPHPSEPPSRRSVSAWPGGRCPDSGPRGAVIGGDRGARCPGDRWEAQGLKRMSEKESELIQ